MPEARDLAHWLLLAPVVGGSVFAILSTVTALLFFRHRTPRHGANTFQPPLTLLKPVHGMEKNLAENLRSACLQDYPHYQVLFSIQDPHDPARPLIEALRDEFGPERVTVVIGDVVRGPNGKVNNLLGALPEARHELLVLSDSDALLDPHYLKAIVAPFADDQVGVVCTPFRLIKAGPWYERMELLSLNADFMPSVMFATVTGAANACLGPSMAFRRSTLEAIGGLESLSHYLVEDYEMGRRIWNSGKKMVLVPHPIDVVVDLRGVKQWWTHQVYWDQNTRFAQPLPFFFTILIRAVPFALLFALLRLGDPLGLAVLAGTVALRLACSAITLGQHGLRDR